jgi:hypothetical protein
MTRWDRTYFNYVRSALFNINIWRIKVADLFKLLMSVEIKFLMTYLLI